MQDCNTSLPLYIVCLTRSSGRIVRTSSSLPDLPLFVLIIYINVTQKA